MSSKQISCTPQPSLQIQPAPKAQTHYIPKNKFSPVLQVEPEYWDKNPNKIISKIFPEGFHYKPSAFNKTRQFYEFILVDTDSISIKHYKDPKDSSNFTHSTFQILKVLTPSQFGNNPNVFHKFSQIFDPIGYTYWDYIDAWSHVFWYQNKTNRHSWLIYFKRNVKYRFPEWFLQWWDFYGPLTDILPSPADEGFKLFQSKYEHKGRISADLTFFLEFSLAWVFSWQYKFVTNENPNRLPSLQRSAFIKWWAQFDASRANPTEVKQWFTTNSAHLKLADPETSLFLNQKAHITAALAASQTKDSLAQNLQNILNLLQQGEGSSSKRPIPSSSVSTASDDMSVTEDDCFGLNLDQD